MLPATSASDVICEECQANSFSNMYDAQECTQYKKCKVDQFWKQPSGTATTDIECAACAAGKFQPLEDERINACGYTSSTSQASTVTTFSTVYIPGVSPTEAFGPGGDDTNSSILGNNTGVETAKGGMSLYLMIAIACGGTIVLLVIGMLISRCCKKKASYLTASAWSNQSANRTWQGGYDDGEDDEELLGGM